MLERYIPDKIIEKAISSFARTKSPDKVIIISSASAALSGFFYTIGQNLEAALFIAINIHCMLIAIESSRKNAQKNTDTIHNYNRVSDAFIYTGLAASPYVSDLLGILTLASAILLPHLSYRLRAFKSIISTKTSPITRLDTTAILLSATILSPVIPESLTTSAIIIITLNTISLAITIIPKKNHKM